METVARQLVRWDIIADVAGRCDLEQQVADHAADPLLGTGDSVVAVQERRELAVVMPMRLVGDEGIGLQHRVQPLAGRARSVPGVGKLVEVAGDLPFVPGEQDRFDVWEVLGRAGVTVQSRP